MITKIRAQQIVLDMPTEAAEVWARVMVQKVVKDADYNTIQVIDRTSHIHREMSDFYGQSVTVVDPVSNAEITLSGAAIGAAMAEMVKTWMLTEHTGATENEYGDIITN